MELLRKKEVKEELQNIKSEGMLNIQLLVVRLSLHTSTSSGCAEGKVYNEKIQFT